MHIYFTYTHYYLVNVYGKKLKMKTYISSVKPQKTHVFGYIKGLKIIIILSQIAKKYVVKYGM